MENNEKIETVETVEEAATKPEILEFSASDMERAHKDGYNAGYLQGCKDMITMMFRTLDELGSQIQDLEKRINGVETPVEEPVEVAEEETENA